VGKVSNRQGREKVEKVVGEGENYIGRSPECLGVSELT
jgi:hypothetical protein